MGVYIFNLVGPTEKQSIGTLCCCRVLPLDFHKISLNLISRVFDSAQLYDQKLKNRENGK